MGRAVRISVASVAAVLGGCAATPPEPAFSTGLNQLVGSAPAPATEVPTLAEPRPAPGTLASEAARVSALDLLAWHDRQQAAGAAPPPPSRPSDTDTGAPQPAPPPPSAQTAPETPAADPLDGAVSNLESILRERARAGGADPGAVLALAALEPLRPGIAADAADGAAGALSPAEHSAIRAVAGLLAEAAQPGALGDPGRIADALESAAQSMADVLPVRIAAAELCTRVDGFGQYQPVPGNVFRAMTPHRVIVYTEVERFAYRPISSVDLGGRAARPGESWAVHLTQELELYNESGGLSAWSRPALPIIETSRNRRRDFHIVDQIDLPPNLSIGVYRLKITVKDKATGSQDSRTIEIRVVADPALARSR